MSLWLCLRFENFFLQSLSLEEDIPIAVFQDQRIISINNHAFFSGIRKGLLIEEAQALNSNLKLLKRNKSAEKKCLEELCLWAYSITPRLNIWHNSLRLEIGGCLKLFGDLNNLLSTIDEKIMSIGYDVRYGIAPTAAASWLISHRERKFNIAFNSNLKERISPLPLNLLGNFNPTINKLNLSGLNTFGDIIKIPSQDLKIRFEGSFIEFIEYTLGRREEIFNDYYPKHTFLEQQWFDYSVRNKNEMISSIERLLVSLNVFLSKMQVYTNKICWLFHSAGGDVEELMIQSTSCCANYTIWHRLTLIKFENQIFKTAVEGLSLRCENFISTSSRNFDLFPQAETQEPREDLLDKLRSRLHSKNIRRLGCRDEHVPEYAVYTIADDDSRLLSNIKNEFNERPFWLLPKPQQLKHHEKKLYWKDELHLISGPERIEDNWWSKPISRDYYIAKNIYGDHYWIFCNRRTKRWYIQGIFP